LGIALYSDEEEWTGMEDKPENLLEDLKYTRLNEFLKAFDISLLIIQFPSQTIKKLP
jgi:hypothetical protein